MTNYRCMFSTSDRRRKLNQLRWQNMSAHLTNETSYWLKKLLMHQKWAIYNVSDLNIDTHICFFPTLSQDRARPIPLAQPEACPQRSERPVRARSPHRSRNGYPGCSIQLPWPSGQVVIQYWSQACHAEGPGFAPGTLQGVLFPMDAHHITLPWQWARDCGALFTYHQGAGRPIVPLLGISSRCFHPKQLAGHTAMDSTRRKFLPNLKFTEVKT